MVRKAEVLRQYTFYAEATPSERRRIEAAGTLVRLAEGQFHFLDGESCNRVALLGSGCLRVYKSGMSGREITLYRVRRGETCLLTSACILLAERYPATAAVELPGEAVVFPADVFRGWVSTDNRVREMMLHTLAAQLSSVMSLVGSITLRRVDERLAQFLVHSFSREHGFRTCLYMTHEQIATEIGSSREVISRTLKGFEQDGAVDLSRGCVRLRDRDVLTQLYGENES